MIQARAQKAIAIGEMFPQQQYVEGSYNREAVAVPPNSVPSQRFFDQWNYGFALSWQLDLWGQLRRAVASADDNLNASVWNYDFVLVTLLSEVATNYVTIRTDQERIRLLQANAKLQRDVLKFVSDRFNAGYKQTELDLDQAVANLRQTEAGIPPLEIAVRQAEDALCILMGMPPVDLARSPRGCADPHLRPRRGVGVPADLVRRRPDVRQAEYLAAAQGEQIGIAQAALYPMFSIDGSFGYTALNFTDLFRPTAFNGAVGPSFQWNLLNYGRIINNVRLQDATFQQLAVTYQQTVLQAAQQVEDGLVTFLRSQRQTKLLDESVVAADKAVKIAISQYQVGATNFNTYATIVLALVTQEDQAAQCAGQIAQGLISVYLALGGGWEIACDNGGTATPSATPPSPAVPANPPTAPASTPTAPSGAPAPAALPSPSPCLYPLATNH